MKQIICILSIVITSHALHAQTSKYQSAMLAQISTLDSVKGPDNWLESANAFQRIADTEKTEWLPYYYAAVAQVMYGYMLGNPGVGGTAEKTDPVANKAEELLLKAESLAKGENSEILLVKKMIATLKMMADPMNRWQKYAPIATQALEKAKQLNPSNPRIYYLEGQDKFYTPEQFGGSKSEAKVLFEESFKKYETFKPESPLHPTWGISQVRYFHSLCK